MSPPSISAYVPCFNNEPTLTQALSSVRAQQPAVEDFFLIDDGSTDASVELARSLGVRAICNGANLGRGAVRARAMQEAQSNLVLCCDATNTLDPHFLEIALPWFDDPQVAAVFGRFIAARNETTVDRWRSRHLFKCGKEQAVSHRASLITSGAVIRKNMCMAVGGYDPGLRHSEDGDLGERLLAAGYDVIFDPGLIVVSVAKNTLGQVLERYWRWYAGKNETISLTAYLKQIVYSIKVMAVQDIGARDPLCVPISLLTPHYQFWRSLFRKASQSL